MCRYLISFTLYMMTKCFKLKPLIQKYLLPVVESLGKILRLCFQQLILQWVSADLIFLSPRKRNNCRLKLVTRYILYKLVISNSNEVSPLHSLSNRIFNYWYFINKYLRMISIPFFTLIISLFLYKHWIIPTFNVKPISSKTATWISFIFFVICKCNSMT